MRRRREPEPPPRRPRVAGSISPEPPQDDGPPAEPPEPAPAESARHAVPRSFDLVARFTVAARALTFAEQAMRVAQRDTADCYRAEDGGWWVRARAPLGAAREMAGLGAGRLYGPLSPHCLLRARADYCMPGRRARRERFGDFASRCPADAPRCHRRSASRRSPASGRHAQDNAERRPYDRPHAGPSASGPSCSGKTY